MAILKLYLVQKFDPVADGFGEQYKASAGQILAGYFAKAIPKTAFSSVQFTWSGAAGDVTQFDLVCYCVPTPNESVLVAANSSYSGQLGGSGSTVQVGATVLSEVYMAALRGNDPRGAFDARRNVLLANIVFHEWMHNLLDATDPALMDVHAVPGGVLGVGTAITSNMSASPGDIKAMHAGLRRKPQVAEYTDGM